MTCKECEFYESYKWKEGDPENWNASCITWHCTNRIHIGFPSGIYNGHWAESCTKNPCEHFTPKKLKEPICKYTKAVITWRLAKHCNSCTAVEDCKFCKRCEYYKAYDSSNDGCDNDYVMYCKYQSAYMKNSLGTCSRFKPIKKPKEPERKCENCFNNPKNNATKKNCWDGRNYGDCVKNNLKHWQPIPKEPEKKCHQPLMLELPLVWDKEPKKNCSDCGRIKTCFGLIPREPCTQWIPKKPKPIKKEKTMKIGIFKFSIRRYMVLCTALVTVRIAIWLNPLVYRFWHTIDLNWNEWRHGGEHVGPWILTIGFIGGIYGSLWLWNRLSVWVFGEKS